MFNVGKECVTNSFHRVNCYLRHETDSLIFSDDVCLGLTYSDPFNNNQC